MSPHLTFLTNASHLLAHTSPQTSAHLHHHRTALLLASSPTAIPSTLSDASHRQHACTACGHIFLPGQNGDTLTIRSDKIPSSKSKARKTQHRGKKPTTTAAATTPHPRAVPAGVSKVLKCGTCAALTVLRMPAPGRISRRSLTAAAPQHTAAVVEPAAPAAGAVVGKSANANSKKRAKNRKAGLQALLDEKKKTPSSASGGLGLSLADFMKK